MKINQVNLLILCDIRIATFSVSITNIVKHRLHVWSEYIFLLCWFIIYSPSSWQPAAVAARDAGVRWEERGAVLKFWSLQSRDICRFCCRVSPRDVMLQVAAAQLSVSEYFWNVTWAAIRLWLHCRTHTSDCAKSCNKKFRPLDIKSF